MVLIKSMNYSGINDFDTYFIGIYYSKSITGILKGYKVFCETIHFSYKNPILYFTETDNRVRYYSNFDKQITRPSSWHVLVF